MLFYEKIRHRLEHRVVGFDFIFEYLRGVQNPYIVETGCARKEDNYSGDGLSSLLFDSYINEYGGEFHTVDNSAESVRYCAGKVSPSTVVILDDSLSYLKKLNSHLLRVNKKIDFLYLDSLDSPKENPDASYMSALHHFYEYTTILPSLKYDALIGVDDCWLLDNMVYGKGKVIFDYMQKTNNFPCAMGYQFFWRNK